MLDSSVVEPSVAGSPPQSPAHGASKTLKHANVFEVVSQIPLAKKVVLTGHGMKPRPRKGIGRMKLDEIAVEPLGKGKGLRDALGIVPRQPEHVKTIGFDTMSTAGLDRSLCLLQRKPFANIS